MFGRAPDYDTNADPVVRMAAGEIRKRIAQYYHEASHPCQLQIELPSGAYVARFQVFRQNAAYVEVAPPSPSLSSEVHEAIASPAVSQLEQTPASVRPKLQPRLMLLGCAISLLVGLVWIYFAQHKSPLDQA